MENKTTTNDCSSFNATDPGFNYLTKNNFENKLLTCIMEHSMTLSFIEPLTKRN